MRKHIKFAVVALLCLALLVVCLLNIGTTDSLMSPPKLSGEYGEIVSAVETAVSCEVTLRSGSSASNPALSQQDVNGDGTVDAFVFYSTKTDTQIIYMCLLLGDGDSWKYAGSVRGEGCALEEYSCRDIDSDGVCEFIVGWDVSGSIDSNSLCIYSLTDSSGKQQLTKCDSLPYLAYSVAQLQDNGRVQIFVISNIDKTNCATVYELQSNTLKSICDYPVYSGFISYENICPDISVEDSLIYIDGYTDEDTLTTECMIYANQKLSDFPYSGEHEFTDVCLRNTYVLSDDADGDGAVEFPVEVSMPGGREGSLIKRVHYNGTKFTSVSESFVNSELFFTYPEKWTDKVFVTVEGENIFSFYCDDNAKTKLFEITVVTISKADSQYEKLLVDNGRVYELTYIDSSQTLSLTQSEITDCIQSVN